MTGDGAGTGNMRRTGEGGTKVVHPDISPTPAVTKENDGATGVHPVKQHRFGIGKALDGSERLADLMLREKEEGLLVQESVELHVSAWERRRDKRCSKVGEGGFGVSNFSGKVIEPGVCEDPAGVRKRLRVGDGDLKFREPGD